MPSVTQLPANPLRFEEAHALLQQPGGLSGEVAVRVTVLAEIKRAYSHLQKVEVTTPTRQFQAYIKQYLLKEVGASHREMMRDRVQHDYAITSTLSARFEMYPGLHVQRPVACFPDLMIVMFEASRGDNFQSYIQRYAYGWPTRRQLHQLCDYAEQCGVWQQRLQKLYPADQSIEAKAMWAYIDQRLRRLVVDPRSSLDDELYLRLRRYFDRLIIRVGRNELRMAAAHADFFPGNVLVDDMGITVLDLAMFTESSVYHDVAHFYHHLDLLRFKPIYRRRVIRELQQAFLRGYKPHFDCHSAMFKVFRLQHVITHLHQLYRLDRLPLHERWYNRRICRDQERWMVEQITE